MSLGCGGLGTGSIAGEGGIVGVTVGERTDEEIETGMMRSETD